MAYKDKDKQREADRERQRRRRDKVKAKGVTNEGVTQSVTDTSEGTFMPEGIEPQVPANYGQPDCECRHCRTNRNNGGKHVLNHGPYKTVAELGPNELNRVSLPGDVDYDGVCLAEKYKERWIS